MSPRLCAFMKRAHLQLSDRAARPGSTGYSVPPGLKETWYRDIFFFLVPTWYRSTGSSDNTKAVYTVAPVDGFCPPKNVHRTELRLCGPGVVGAFHQDVQSPGEVVSDSESDEAWVVMGEAPTESLQRVGNQSEPESCSEPDVDLDGSEESQRCEATQVPPAQLRRSSRATAGRHSNPFNLPRSVGSNGEDSGVLE